MSRTSSPSSKVPGKGPNVPGYTIKEVLGRGSMGMVFRAIQNDMERDVALKILSARLANDPTYVQRFIREARATAKVNHPNIVQGYDVGQANGVVYFAMELVDGESLMERLERTKTINWRDAINIGTQICKALQAAHEAGLVHRDVKPDNILCSASGNAKLVDLGLVKQIESEDDDASVTQAGQAVGTPNYIAPEQARGQEIDIRADIYSLGATLYHLVMGHALFPNRAASAAMTAQVIDSAPNPLKEKPELPEPLVRVLVKSLAKDPKDRYGLPKIFGEELQAVLDGEAIPLAVSFKGKSSLEAPKPLSRSKLPSVAGRKSSGAYKAVSAKKIAAAKGAKEREVFFKEKAQADETPMPGKPATPERPMKPALADLDDVPETESRIGERKRRRIRARGEYNSTMIGMVSAGAVVLIVLLVILSSGPSTPPPKKTVIEYIPDPMAENVPALKHPKETKPVLDKKGAEASEALNKALTYDTKTGVPEPLERIKRLWDIRDTVQGSSSEKKWDDALATARKALHVQLALLKTYPALESMKAQCVLDPAREEYETAHQNLERYAMEREWKPVYREAQLKAEQGEYDAAIALVAKFSNHEVPAIAENARRESAKWAEAKKQSEEKVAKEKTEAKDTIGRARFEFYRSLLPVTDDLDFTRARNLLFAAKGKAELKPMADEFVQIAADFEWMEKQTIKAATVMAEKKATVDYVLGPDKRKRKGVVQSWKDGKLEIKDLPPPPTPGQPALQGAVFQIMPDKVHLRSVLTALGWSFEGDIPEDQALEMARYIFWRNRLDPALSRLPKTETPAVVALREKIELVINGTNRFYPPETPRDLTALVPDDFVQLDGKVKGEHTDATIELSWKMTGQNTRKFKLERKKGEEDYEALKELDKAELSFKDEKLPLQTKFTYRVTAINDAGESKPGNEVSITTPAPK